MKKVAKKLGLHNMENKNKFILGSSWSPRCIQTISEVANVLSLDKTPIHLVEKLAYKNKDLEEDTMTSLRNKFMNEYTGDETKSETAFIQYVTENEEARNKVLPTYLKIIQKFFDHVDKKGKKQIISFFRHGEKTKTSDQGDDIYNSLSVQGKEQARNLGGFLKDTLFQEENATIRLLSGHALVNECIAAFLFGLSSLPESWKKNLGYAENVTYIFEKQGEETVLRLHRAGEERVITKKEFEKCLNSLNFKK